MATIAKLTKNKDGSFRGTLILPSLAGAEIIFRPIEKQTPTGPAYRAYIAEFESGAAWKTTSKKGKSYFSVRLTDPTFHNNTIYPALLKTNTEYLLDWTPPRRNKTSAPIKEQTEF